MALARLTTTRCAMSCQVHYYPSYSGDSNYSAASSNTIAQAVTAWIPPPAAIYSYSIPTPATQFTGYMPNGNLLGYTDSVMGPWNFYYDSLNRMTGAEAGLGPYQGLQMSWSYDSFGNRLTQTDGGGMNIWTQSGNDTNGNPHNQVTGTNARGVSWTPDYDAAGNMLDDGANQYLYDADGHVCAVRNLTYGGMTGYLYNASGTRVAKGTITSLSCDPTSNGFTTSGSPYTQYILGPNGEQMTEMAVSGGTSTWLHTNAYAGGAIATYLNDNVSPHFRFADWLGTMRAQTDSAGNLELTCQSLPFGDTSAQCTPATEQFYTGQERDQESGNDYFQARYFGSSMGRFLSPDPLAGNRLNPQSLNRYVYALNNPLRFTDPTGMYVCEDSQNCDSDNDKKFAMGLINAEGAAFELTIKYGLGSNEAENAHRAVDAYGKEGVENGVNVRFDSKIESGTGVTDVSGVANGRNDADNDNPNKQNINVTFNPDAAGDSSLIAHEGSHVADGEAWVASGFLASADPTIYRTEVDAYHVQFDIIEAELGNNGFGSIGGVGFTSRESFREFMPDLWGLLKGKPYNLSPTDKTPAFTKGSVVPY